VLQNLLLAVGFGFVTTAVVALAAVGFTMQYAITHHVNFAYGSYMALAAFGAWEVQSTSHQNFWVAALIGSMLTGLLAVLIAKLLLQPFKRRNPPAVFMLIVTLGMWLILSNLMLVIWGPDGREFRGVSQSAMHIGPFRLTGNQIAIVIISIVLLVGVHLLLTRTKLGKTMRAMSDNSTLAQVSGINTERVATFTWALTGILVGFSGCVLALVINSFTTSFGDTYLFVIYAAVILGGIGRPYGAMLGAVVIGFSTEVAAVILPSQYKVDVAFAVLIVLLFVRPQGIFAAQGVTN
jgi:branched-subunit amino acid ABC-type transport system permease component